MEKNDAANLDAGIAMAVATFVEALGMHWANQERLAQNESPAYGEDQFRDLIENNGCHWNSVMGKWYPSTT